MESIFTYSTQVLGLDIVAYLISTGFCNDLFKCDGIRLLESNEIQVTQ